MYMCIAQLTHWEQAPPAADGKKLGAEQAGPRAGDDLPPNAGEDRPY